MKHLEHPDLKSAKTMTPLELNSVPVAANGPVITDDDLKKSRCTRRKKCAIG